MGYPWAKEDDEAQRAERIPYGKSHVRIVKVVLGSRNALFQSQKGDPQIMLVFQDQIAREITDMVTLSDDAVFTLRRYMAAFDPPINMKRMEEDDIKPTDFAKQEFADAQLVDRQLMIDIMESKDPKYPDIMPIRSEASVPPSTDDGPPSSKPPPLARMTKEEAWLKVRGDWDNNSDPNSDERRNKAWLQAVGRIDKLEIQYTPEDWAKVANEACVPF